MTAIRWTAQQELAIRTVDRDVLLTAAAGAGKTAVLAGRCTFLLTEAPEPCNVDQLLVLTFTRAAAAEMRSRIARALREKALAQPGDSSLRRQLALLDKAAITTVHSFCNSLLREFYYRLPLDPNFEILDDDEAELLKLRVADELLEAHYAGLKGENPSETFERFVQCYSSGSGDRRLVNLIIRLHNFLDTLSDHRLWLESWREGLRRIEGADAPRQLHIVENQKTILQVQLNRIVDQLRHSLSTIDYFPALGFYTAYVRDRLLPVFETMQQYLAADDLAGALAQCESLLSLPRAPSRPRHLTAEDITPVKDSLDQVKSEAREMVRKYAVGADEVRRQLSATLPYIDLLHELHSQFVDRYESSKRRQNALDFADLEHKCLQLLRADGGSGRVGTGSDVAVQLRARYRYVLVDEYQDISPIQEAIIQSISRSGASTIDELPNQDTPSDQDAPSDRTNLSSPGGNLFMVGDVKQSIYGFRQADPEIFLNKYHAFAPLTPGGDSPGNASARIDLNENFRSRRSVIDAVNFIFSRCMTESFSGIDYERDAQLVFGAEYYQTSHDDSSGESSVSSDRAVEVHLIESDLPADTSDHISEPNHSEQNDSDSTTDSGDLPDLNELDATRREALIVARRIREMVGADAPGGQAAFEVIDPQTGQRRAVQYRDVVILLRSMKHRAELWSEVFHRLGIPVHADLSSGYFVATEIQDMISLLTLLDNPQQDIPLAAVLRGPLVGLNESQLAAVRRHGPDHSYYHAVRAYAHHGPDKSLGRKISDFLGRLERWRSQGRRGDLAGLIWTIYRDSNLLAYVSALPEGRQRYGNLLHLHDRARQFDSFARQGLSRFLRFIEKLRSEEGDFGPAPVLSEADNVVRIMSIHRSKGLEFPVVIVADLARRFNRTDSADSILFTRAANCPVGLKIVDAVSQDRWPTVAHSLVGETLKQKLLAEELRILYVALTRAREHLLLFASVPLDRYRRTSEPWRFYPGKPLPEFVLATANSPLDWLSAAWAAHQDFQAVLGDCDSPVARPNLAAPARFAVQEYDSDTVRDILTQTPLQNSRMPAPRCLDELIPAEEDRTHPSDQARAIIDRVRWSYPHQLLTHLSARVSVTELKRQLDSRRDADPVECPTPNLAVPHADGPRPFDGDGQRTSGGDSHWDLPGAFRLRPRFLSETPNQPLAAEKGTWMHFFLQRLDLDAPLDGPGLAGQLEQMKAAGILTDLQAGHINPSQVEQFFAAPLGQRMLAHRGSLQREWNFTLALPAQQVYRQVDLSAADWNEPVLVRGIIDCFFETGEGIVIVDYKTDQVSEAQCLGRAQEYYPQLQLYRRAVKSILNRPVSEMVLYFLTPGLAVPVPVGDEN